MANAAQKKREQRATAAAKYLAIVFALVTALYLAVNLLLVEESDPWFPYNAVLHTGLAAMLCVNIVSSERSGMPYSYKLDLAGLNWLIQVGSLYSDAFWKLMWLVPGFAAYKAATFIKGFVFPPRQPEEPVDQAALDKKRKKMERQQARAGIAMRG